MCKFKQIYLRSKPVVLSITNDRIASPYQTCNNWNCPNLRYIPDILSCYGKYAKYLQDDYAGEYGFLNMFASYPNFWVITDMSDEFMGFVFLDNFIGNGSTNFSAELTVCFDKKAWGSYSAYCAKIFLKQCFDRFGFYKIKVLVFPDNYRTKTLMKKAGFEYETTLPCETLRNGQLQDIEVYSIKRKYYYKDEVNYVKH